MVKLIRFLLTFGVATATAQPTPIREYPMVYGNYLVLQGDSVQLVRRVYPKTEQGFPFRDYSVREAYLSATGFLTDTVLATRLVRGEAQIDSFVLTGPFRDYRYPKAGEDTVLAGYGQYVDGRREGTWVWLYWNQQKSAVEEFRNGNLVSVQYFKEDGSPEPAGHVGDREPAPLNLPEVHARIRYPKLMRNAGVGGLVKVRLLLDKEGNYLKHIIMESAHPELTKAVEPHLRKLRFSPGVLHNEAIKVWVTIPFNFRILDQ